MIPLTDLVGGVFSAHAEVVPWVPQKCNPWGRILRARGGSSTKTHGRKPNKKYSPRTRR